MHQITSQPLDQAQYEPVRLARGREDIRERWARYLNGQSQMASQACAIDKHPEDSIFEKVDLGIVGHAQDIVPRQIEDMKRQRAGA